MRSTPDASMPTKAGRIMRLLLSSGHAAPNQDAYAGKSFKSSVVVSARDLLCRISDEPHTMSRTADPKICLTAMLGTHQVTAP